MAKIPMTVLKVTSAFLNRSKTYTSKDIACTSLFDTKSEHTVTHIKT